MEFVLIPISKLYHALFILEVLRTKKHTLTPSSDVCILRFVFESFKEFGGALAWICNWFTIVHLCKCVHQWFYKSFKKPLFHNVLSFFINFNTSHYYCQIIFFKISPNTSSMGKTFYNLKYHNHQHYQNIMY